MKAIDIKFCELCEEIDFWKAKAEFLEHEYKELLKKYNKVIREDIKRNHKMIGEIFKFALNKE